MSRSAVLVLLAAFTAACPSETASVKGRVVLSSVAGTNDFSRVLVSLSPSAAEVVPETDGTFVLEDLQPGSYTLQVVYRGGPSPTSASSAYRLFQRTVELEAGENTTEDVVLELVRGTVTGTVEVAGGSPSAGTVTLARADGQSANVTLGADGNFTFTDVPLGTHTITAAVNGTAIAAGTPCSLSASLVDDNGSVNAGTLRLVSADVTLTPGMGQTSAVNGNTWTLVSGNVTVDVNGGFIRQVRHALDGAMLPAYEMFNGTVVLFGLSAGTHLLVVQVADGCGFESPVYQLELVAP